MAHAKLSPTQIDKKVIAISGWTLNKTKTQLSKTFEFNSYLDGLAFIARVAVYAEVSQHHPEIELTYKKVKIKLTTHDVKGLSNADFDIAQKVERIINR